MGNICETGIHRCLSVHVDMHGIHRCLSVHADMHGMNVSDPGQARRKWSGCFTIVETLDENDDDGWNLLSGDLNLDLPDGKAAFCVDNTSLLELVWRS